MLRTAAVALAFLLAGAPQIQAQDWARKMFKVDNHDFGYVARGADVEYAFELTNLYKEDVHVSSVRSSCGCTTPSISKETLKTHEKGAILAKLNTRSFLGQKSATITVTIDKPFFAEVQLTVSGYIRSDVVFNPGAISFGNVAEGAVSEQRVSVTYAGRNDWKIVDIRSANKNVEVEMNETQRGDGRVAYDLLVRLKPDAPVGYIHDDLVLVTNDTRAKQVPLALEGQVMPGLTVSPAALYMGEVEPGETVQKQVIVRGKTPFHIVGVNCPDASFAVTMPSEAKTLHVIPITFTAGSEPGKVVQKIEIQTDSSGSTAKVVASATIKAAAPASGG